jgi:hypothetical protein
MALRVALATVLLAVLVPGQTSAGGGTRDTTTRMISQARGGGTPNGASTNAVISQDLRYARIIAFESEASNLVAGDSNDAKDVFAIRRAGRFGNRGTPWRPGRTQLVSRARGGGPANGPSFDPAVDGNFEHRATCVAFLSDASNLSQGDGDGATDAFLAKAPGFRPKRISPGNKGGDTTAVAVSGNCSRTAFVTGGKLYVRRGARTRRLRTRGTPGNPAFSVGRASDLVFDTPRGIYLSRGGTRRPRRVARGGRNPAFNDVRRQVIAYERQRGGNTQIAFRRLGGRERIASAYRGRRGNRDSRDPVIVNSGYFIGFESGASNLPIKATGERGDRNGQPDAYIYTDTRKVTILESVNSSLDPFRAGARRPDTSYYRNYVVFDSSANSPNAPPQVYLRYVGAV